MGSIHISHTHFPGCPLSYSSNLCPTGQYPQSWSYHSVSRISPWDSPVKDGIYLKHMQKPIMDSILISLPHTHTLSPPPPPLPTHTLSHTHTFQTVPFHTVPTCVPMDKITRLDLISVSRISPWDSPVKYGIYLKHTREILLWAASLSLSLTHTLSLSHTHTHFPDCPLSNSSNLCPNGQYPQSWSYHSVRRISPWESPVKDGISLTLSTRESLL